MSETCLLLKNLEHEKFKEWYHLKEERLFKREREDGEREGERERERQTDRQTDRQTEREDGERHRERQRD